MLFKSAVAVVVGLIIVVLSEGGEKAALLEKEPTLKGGKAKYTEKELMELEKEFKGIPAKYYHVTVEDKGKKVTLGSAEIRRMQVLHVYSPEFEKCKIGKEVLQTVGDYVRTIWTSEPPEELEARIKRVNKLLEMGVYK